MKKISKEQLKAFIDSVEDPGKQFKPSLLFSKDENWIDKFYDRHQAIYNSLNKNTILRIDPEFSFTTKQAGKDATFQTSQRILKIIPGYLNCYGFYTDVFANPYIKRPNGS